MAILTSTAVGATPQEGLGGGRMAQRDREKGRKAGRLEEAEATATHTREPLVTD